MENYLTCKIYKGCRLGNQLFMISHCIAQSLEYKRQYLLSKDQMTDLEKYKDNVFRNIEFKLDCLPKNGKIRGTPSFNFTKLKPYNNRITIYQGYFQSEKNFLSYSAFIKSLFSPTENFKKTVYINHPELLNENVTCINVRRGDYLLDPQSHPVITPEYIYEAANEIKHTDRYFIISDDLEWCKENIKLPKAKYVDVSLHEALWTMSLCHNFIISNSSFSWWGAYLSNNENKKVIAPKTWAGPTGPQNTQDVICDSWTALETRYENGKIYPI